MSDTKTFDRIRKLLALANDGGATEAEASSAMAKAQEIMAANNLTMATLEAQGQQTEGGKRLQNGFKGKAAYEYQQRLMSTIADVNMCACYVRKEFRGNRYVATGYTLIGREVNVVSTLTMFDYLNSTAERMVMTIVSTNAERLSKRAISFKEGLTQRLAERLRRRHQEQQEAQSQAARETNQGSTASGGSALVVVMEDFAAKEQYANMDLRFGWEPGTAEQKALQADLNSQEYSRREEERRAALTEEERQAEDAKAEKNSKKWQDRYQRQQDRYWASKDMGAYYKGRSAAEDVGLDAQVTESCTTKIGR